MQRKLAAILSADVAGYSGLMEADEAGTLTRLKSNRARIFDPHVNIHGGRLFKLMGDGALVEFASVIAAVNCSLAIQEATEQAASADAMPIRYRIGINLGEVIVDGDDIYGEGVNVAARIQALAPVGGVAVSRVVRDQVRGKVPCEFDDMGEHSVKNIEAPVHVYSARVAVAAAEPARAVERPAQLSICVLPFANVSGDPEQEYFSDGISEDIITDLTKVSALRVISRNTAFTFKGRHVDLPQLARQLKVSHVLEGSVRKAGGRVRITAQLIDGAADSHIWAERYDRDLNDIFALQDEISEAIVAALKLKLLPEEKKAIEQRGTDNVEAYNLYLMARQYSVTASLGDVRMSEAIVRLCRRALEIDPDYAAAWALIATMQINLRFYMGREGDTGLEAAEQAIALDPELAEAHAAKAVVRTFEGDTGGARAEIEIALRLDPESYEVNRSVARFYYQQRDRAAAIPFFEKAATLMETDYWASGMLPQCYKQIGDKEATLRAAKRSLARAESVIAKDPNNGSAMSFAIEALTTLGEAERAKDLMSRALLLDPTNLNMRYNLACALWANLHDPDAALDMLEPLFQSEAVEFLLNWSRTDNDMDGLREHPRFVAMTTAAQARLAAKNAGGPTASG
jgi:adenylate cyclase